MQINVKTSNKKELWLQALVGSGYTHIGINKQLVAEWITQGRINHGIKIKICDTMFLYPKERWIITIGTRLQKIELVYDKR